MGYLRKKLIYPERKKLMNNVQKLKLNTSMSLLNRVVLMISGLTLPRLILLNYGSETNGLVSSIAQFLSIITFLDLGVGSVVQSVLYKPLADHDLNMVSGILKSAKKYFRKISYILIIYTIALIFLYPIIINTNTSDLFSTGMLVFAISINQFAQYYFGIINEFLLNADQKAYLQLGVEILVVILNLIASIVLIYLNFPIYVVKLAASLIFLIRPFLLNLYVKKNYTLNLNINLTHDPLPQKWSGMGQHIAFSIQNSTDITILTLFSTLESVSIYSVYNLVINAIKLIIISFTTGLQSFFGNLLAKEYINEVNMYFSKLEWGLHTLVITLYSITAVLITPFVMLYTRGVTDVSYNQPLFATVIVFASLIFSLRIPYQSLVFAAGRFRETQISSYIEASLNIIISLVLVNYFDLVGVALGTFVSMLYRLVYLSWYLSKNIVYRPVRIFIKQLFVDGISLIFILFSGHFIVNYFSVNNYIEWVTIAIIVSLVALIFVLLINSIFYWNFLLQILRKK